MAALQDLRDWAPEERKGIIDEQIALLEAAVQSSTDSPDHARTGLVEDREGSA